MRLPIFDGTLSCWEVLTPRISPTPPGGMHIHNQQPHVPNQQNGGRQESWLLAMERPISGGRMHLCTHPKEGGRLLGKDGTRCSWAWAAGPRLV